MKETNKPTKEIETARQQERDKGGKIKNGRKKETIRRKEKRE